MTQLVLDASVAAKWFLPEAGEPLAARALELLELHAEGRIGFLVPDLFWAEFANILWKAARQGRWPEHAANEALKEMRRQKLSTFAMESVIEDALELAFATKRAVYDCVYLSLALAQGASMITADERLANAVGGALPVQWLGAFRIGDFP